MTNENAIEALLGIRKVHAEVLARESDNPVIKIIYTDKVEALDMAIKALEAPCRAENTAIDERNEDKGTIIPPSENEAETGDFLNKYIITLGEPFNANGIKLWRAKGFRSLVFDENGLRNLKPYTVQSIKDAVYNNGFNNGYEKGRQEALEQIRGDVKWILDGKDIERLGEWNK